jgi:hypothetical protein
VQGSRGLHHRLASAAAHGMPGKPAQHDHGGRPTLPGPDTTLASAFVARWCAGYKVETEDGVFRVRTDEPAARTGASMHRTP